MARPNYLTLQNFRFGLDARRSELTSVPGTLLRAVDCHVNQGGEIEKRKSFVKTALPANTFPGLPAVGTQLVFGSEAAPVMPNGFTYQQLISPLGGSMTALVGATLFAGQAFVVATFTDGTWVFYGGVLVEDFISGVVLAGQTATVAQANAAAALINSTPYYTATVVGSTVIISGTNGNSYGVVSTTDSVAGTVTASQDNLPVPPISAQAATASFQIQAGSVGGFTGPPSITTINAVLNNNPGTVVALIGAPVLFVTNQSQTAIAVAEAINLYQGTSGGYTAIADQTGTVIVTAPLGASANFNGIEVFTTMNNGSAMIVGGTAFTFGTSATNILSVTTIVSGATTIANFVGGINSGGYPTTTAFLQAISSAINGGGSVSPSGFVSVVEPGSNTIYIGLPSTSDFNGSEYAAGQTVVITFNVLLGAPTLTGQTLLKGVPSQPSVAFAVAGVKPGSGNITNGTTGTVGVAVKNGTTPYTYSWSIYGSKFNISINNPTSASTSFTTTQVVVTFPPIGTAKGVTYYATATLVATAICEITDNVGNVGFVRVPIEIIITS